MAFAPSRARCSCFLKLASARSRACFELFAKVVSCAVVQSRLGKDPDLIQANPGLHVDRRQTKKGQSGSIRSDLNLLPDVSPRDTPAPLRPADRDFAGSRRPEAVETPVASMARFDPQDTAAAAIPARF